jgi:hypothetical protein
MTITDHFHLSIYSCLFSSDTVKSVSSKKKKKKKKKKTDPSYIYAEFKSLLSNGSLVLLFTNVLCTCSISRQISDFSSISFHLM